MYCTRLKNCKANASKKKAEIIYCGKFRLMKRLVTVALLGIICTGCNKTTEDDHSASSTNFTSYQRFDINAQRLGSVGDAADDYRMEEWPDWVYDLFKPLDTADITSYNWSEVTIEKLFPNPCADTQILRTYAAQPANLKIVIIDPSKTVYLRKSIHVPSAQHDLGISYKNLNMPGNAYYRMFYSISFKGKPHHQRGHIDIFKTQ